MIETISVANSAQQFIDLSVEELVKHALSNNEGVLAANQAFCASTGARTGRSPGDRFIVNDPMNSPNIDWGTINQPLSANIFDSLWKKATSYVKNRRHYVSHLHVGAEHQYQVTAKVITEFAWHSLFVKQLFIRPENRVDASKISDWTMLCAPTLKLDPAKDGSKSDAIIVLNFAERKILICGTAYAGEMKKAMFTVLNYLLPAQQVLPMHCSANVGPANDVALFFGLSGTGKTTLSADPKRSLIGDDEHGWGDLGVFNFEGGCYAKCINLSQENEPMIWNAIRYGAVVENVVLDQHGVPDYADSSLTENTRAAYPREFIHPCVPANKAGQPKAVIFLTCDLYGVLPPVSLLTKEQAAYHFLSGYTALVGSTEFGASAGVKPTFSTCFGAPFFPRPPKVYAELLMKRIEQSGAQVYLINTGWMGGTYGVGSRFKIPVTRAIVDATLNGDVLKAEKELLSGFNLTIPKALPGVDSNLLNPLRNWVDQDAYHKNLQELMQKFQENFKRFDVSDAIRHAGP